MVLHISVYQESSRRKTGPIFFPRHFFEETKTMQYEGMIKTKPTPNSGAPHEIHGKKSLKMKSTL
jgi:hypothetical protein